MLPTYFKNPFVTTVELYRTTDIFERININMLYAVPFNKIYLRKNGKFRAANIQKRRIVGADTRFPGILYKSHLDPGQKCVEEEYCVFDGTHRILKMQSEGKTSGVFFILTPEIFKDCPWYGEKDNKILKLITRSTSCMGCEE
jgi:hypothetical protein|tara:strand:- start:30 stop:458 length:429 start_codon:yes stop_codon:yes gene_type:complete